MTELIERLIEDMRRFEEEVYPDFYPDYEKAFGERVRAIGERALLVHLFRTRADSTLRVALRRLRFGWRDLSFETWLQILDEVADSRHFLYQILFFFSDTLAIDIRRLSSSQPNVGHELQSAAFRDGVPRPMSKATRIDLDDDFDYESMWRRLASEGAPMLKLPELSTDETPH